jgi:hypothetical protein
MGRQRYPDASELTVTADCGGSNGARVRLWKLKLQEFADETGLTIHVCHFPPGTFQNWRAHPLTDRLAVVELIAATSTKTGLCVESALDERPYEKGIKVSGAEMEALNIRGDALHPEWNYTVNPPPKKNRCRCPDRSSG